MNVSKCDRRVTIQRPVTTRNAYGESVATWTDVATVWAEKLPLSGKEIFAAQQTTAQSQVKYRIRWRSDIRPTIDEDMRLVDGDIVFGIQSIVELGRRKQLEIFVQKPK